MLAEGKDIDDVDDMDLTDGFTREDLLIQMALENQQLQKKDEKDASSVFITRTEILPYKISGNFNGKFSIILLHGFGQNHTLWDDSDRSTYADEKERNALSSQFESKLKGKLNFQKRLSQITSTLSYTQREQLKISNLEQKTSLPEINPDDHWYDPHLMFEDLFNLITYTNLPAPYFLVGFSSGGLLALEFQHRFGNENCCGCMLLDPQHWDLQGPVTLSIKKGYDKLQNMTTEQRLKLYESISVTDIGDYLAYYEYKNWLSKLKMSLDVPIQCYFNLQKHDSEFTPLFLSFVKMTLDLQTRPQNQIKVLFDELHAVHVLHDDEIFEYIKNFEF